MTLCSASLGVLVEREEFTTRSHNNDCIELKLSQSHSHTGLKLLNQQERRQLLCRLGCLIWLLKWNCTAAPSRGTEEHILTPCYGFYLYIPWSSFQSRRGLFRRSPGHRSLGWANNELRANHAVSLVGSSRSLQVRLEGHILPLLLPSSALLPGCHEGSSFSSTVAPLPCYSFFGATWPWTETWAKIKLSSFNLSCQVWDSN